MVSGLKRFSLNQATGLVDIFGRPITYLRISLTEQCNLRCRYCYGDSLEYNSGGKKLSVMEILRLVKAFALLGINKIRFTGGEPLLRKGLSDIVGNVSKLDGISSIGLTTNGLLLGRWLDLLIDAGLNRLNVSLDSLDRNTYKAITGVDGFDRVHTSIAAAEKCGAFDRVNVNMVVMRGINDSEIPRFAEWALNQKIDLRFIEFMPIRKSGWDLFMSEAEIRNRLGLDLEEEPSEERSSGPARDYRLGDHPGRISFISSASRNFCNQCNRIRLTAGGDLVGCLFLDNKVNLKRLLIEGATTDDIVDRVRSVVAGAGFRRLPEGASIGRLKPFMRRVGG